MKPGGWAIVSCLGSVTGGGGLGPLVVLLLTPVF